MEVATSACSKIDRVDPAIDLFEVERVVHRDQMHSVIVRGRACNLGNDDVRIGQDCGADRESQAWVKIEVESADLWGLCVGIRQPAERIETEREDHGKRHIVRDSPQAIASRESSPQPGAQNGEIDRGE